MLFRSRRRVSLDPPAAMLWTHELMDDDLAQAFHGSPATRYVFARQSGAYHNFVREKLLGQLPLEGVVTQVFLNSYALFSSSIF